MAECAIWGTPATELVSSFDGRDLSSYRAGGKYRLARSALGPVEALNNAEKARLTTWLVDQRRSGESNPLITTEVVNVVRSRRALRISERKQRFFLYALSRDFQPSEFFRLGGVVDEQFIRDHGEIAAWTESRTPGDVVALMLLLAQEGLLSSPPPEVRLSAKGFERLESLESGAAPTTQVFVAMWFSNQMDGAYDEGFAPAIRDAGFQPLRIDRKEHGNKIDDEIVAEIRRSRFVVADFTSDLADINGSTQAIARGGVYYEAGLAQGLGIPVVWSCRVDCIDHVHFDTRQFNHIVWESPEELRSRLLNRIRAMIT